MIWLKKALIVFVLIPLTLAMPINAQSVVYNSNIHAGKKIALTFDDGPHPRLTPKILGILDKYSVKATFFVIGQNAKYYPKQLEMIIDNGHEIGNHTYSHKILKFLKKSEIEKELLDAEKQIKEIKDCEINLIRPPCGLYDDNLEQIARNRDDKIVLWAIDTLDWEHTSTNVMVKNVLRNIKDGDIILFHDYVSGEYNTPRALEILIPILLEKGYEFVTVSELLQK
ncbi:MAG: polysaccharide deacetylase family protein [Clostridia bacterium]|nr:polysaccharide deacetylase family protein [Clostridia bacterium]